jgi:hypothetical protein
MLMRFLRIALPSAVAALSIGCGQSGDLAGKLSYRGQPLRFGTVQVRGEDGVVRSSEIGPDGTYLVKGIPAGAAKVSVTCRDPREVEYTRSLAYGGRGGSSTEYPRHVTGLEHAPADFSLVPAIYSELDRSGLETKLNSGTNCFDIDLK